MPTHHQVEAAARIGMLLAEPDAPGACTEALELLRRALPHDAATVICPDPLTGAHVQLAGIGYAPATSEALAAEFVATPWYRRVLGRDLPISISHDPDPPGACFRHGWFYAERVRPAGFRDGMTGVLRHRGRYIGLVHLSTAREDWFDRDAQLLLAALSPALAALADPATRVARDALAVTAALVTADGIVDLPERQRPRVLADPGFGDLVAAFAASGGTRLGLLWQVGRTWYRVLLEYRAAFSPVVGSGVLVQETPVDPPYGLSPRELDVLTRAAAGLTNQAIAQDLYLSPRTVHSHVEHLLRKTGCASRAEATAVALRDGLLRPAPEHVGRFAARG